MSKNYTQLDLVQRYQIEAFLKAGMKQKDIAATINVHLPPNVTFVKPAILPM